MDASRYRTVMRHQAGAVAVIAVGSAGARTGLTATAVCSLTDSPPTILACVNRTASAHDRIAESGSFSINLLSDRQQSVADAFAGRTGLKGEARFDPQLWTTMSTGAPILKGALATLDCRLSQRIEAATHSIFIGAVIDGAFDDRVGALLYFKGDFWDLPQALEAVG
ncbi:MAG: flavin reductase family protein [Hyphomicrobiaceae bacterium]